MHLEQKNLIRSPGMPESIAQVLRAEIVAQGKPGERFHTVRDLCKRFEAATATIRAALKILEREGLLDVWPGSGAFVRERPHNQQHIALVMGIAPEHFITGHYYLRLLEDSHQFFAERGLTPRLYWARPSQQMGSLEEFTRAVARGEVAGVVVLKGPLDAAWWAAIDRCGQPVVGGDRPESKHVVSIDWREFLNEAVRFVRAAGRQRLALLAFTRDKAPRTIPEFIVCDVATYFREALQAQGCQTHEAWIRGDLQPLHSGAGYALMREIWTALPQKPDALVVADDVFFPDVATAIREVGMRVPEDLLVVTHAVKRSGTLYPFPTARLECDPEESANLQGEQLLRLLRKETVAEGFVRLPLRWVGVEEVNQRLSAGRSTQKQNAEARP